MRTIQMVKTEAKKAFLIDCFDDWPAEIWSLIWLIRYSFNNEEYPTKEKDVSNSDVVRQLTLEIIEELLKEEAVDAVFTNYPVTDTYRLELAEMPIPKIMARIRNEWDLLEYEPNMAQIVAFAPKGAMQRTVSSGAKIQAAQPNRTESGKIREDNH